MANFGRGFAQGLSTGYDIGRTMRKDREEEALRTDLANSQTNQVTEQMSGDAALQHFQDNYVAQEGGPATAQEYLMQNPNVMQGMGGRKAGLVVGNQSFTDRGDAQRYADTQNAIAAADTYTKHGKTREALDTRLGALQMEKGGYEMKSLKRRDKQETDKASLDDFIRNSAGMDDDQFLSGIAALASNGKQDNLGFTYSRDPRDGQVYLVQHDRNTRQEMRRIPWDGNRDALLQHTMKYFDAASFDAARKEKTSDDREERKLGLEDRKVKVQEDTLAAHKPVWAAQAGYYNRMPKGGGGDDPLGPQEQDLLRGIMDRYAAEQNPAKRAQIAQEYQLAQSRILLGRGKVPNLPGGMLANPKDAPLLKVKVPSADGKGEVEMQVTQDEAVKMGIIPAPAGTFALRDPAAVPSRDKEFAPLQRLGSTGVQAGGLSVSANDLAKMEERRRQIALLGEWKRRNRPQ